MLPLSNKASVQIQPETDPTTPSMLQKHMNMIAVVMASNFPSYVGPLSQVAVPNFKKSSLANNNLSVARQT
jgi:conjugal transfer/entry exclusion protein